MVVPQQVVVQASDLFLTLRTNISRGQILPGLVEDDDKIIRLVMENLQYEESATLNLALAVVEEMKGAMGENWADEVGAACEFIVTFGTGLFKRLQRLRLYQRSYLYYQFSSFIGRDLILEHIRPDQIGQFPEGESPDELRAHRAGVALSF